MPFSRHWIMHVEASLRIENKIRTKKLWNTSMIRQPFYKNTYFRIRKQE